MELLSLTYLQTTTQMVVNSSTITVANIMNPDVTKQYVSDSLNSDLVYSTIRVNFDSTQTVDRIAIMEANWKRFNVFYNGVTANAFTLTNPTTTSQFTTNSATALYLACTPVACTSVSFDVLTTQVANAEKAIGFLYIGANELTFPRVPNHSGFSPMRDSKELVHELSDGGTRRHVIQTKWKAKIKFKYITESFRESLEDIYDTYAAKTFVAFGTGTAWDGILFECNWVGDFDGNKYSDDAQSSGFDISLDLRQT